MKVSCLALVVALAAAVPASPFAQDSNLGGVTTNGEKTIVTETPAAATTTTEAATVPACDTLPDTAIDIATIAAATPVSVATCTGSAAATGSRLRDALAGNADISARFAAAGAAPDRIVSVQASGDSSIVVYIADAP